MRKNGTIFRFLMRICVYVIPKVHSCPIKNEKVVSCGTLIQHGKKAVDFENNFPTGD